VWSMGSNYVVYDFDTGADKNKKESVVNLVGRWMVNSNYKLLCFDEKEAHLFKERIDKCLLIVLWYGFGKLFSGLHCCLLVTSPRLRGPHMDISGGRKHPCNIICGHVYQVREILLVCGVLKPIGINYWNGEYELNFSLLNYNNCLLHCLYRLVWKQNKQRLINGITDSYNNFN
jgi:1,4-dihydroxy-2-naphthoate octaprenyltransferase